MSFLSRLFGSSPSGGASDDLEERLRKLEADAESAVPGYVGTAYNQAGDLALKAGESGRAMEYYGRSIDAFLEDGQREAARGVANKIIRVRPTAVRTLCTLTWLDLAARHSATALLHLRDYIQAAKDVDQYDLAASQVYDMARLVPESEFIGAVADALDNLDFSSWAEEVREWVGAGGSPNAVADPDELAQACLQAATRSNEGGARSKGGKESGVQDAPEEVSSEEGEDEKATDDVAEEEDDRGVTAENDVPKRRYRWD